LKKAATLLGVGLHLYAGGKQPNHNNNDAKPHNAHGQHERGNGGNGSGNGQGNNGNGRISTKQHKYILNLIKDAGMTKSELNGHCTQMYGSVIDYLNRTDASTLIDWLLSK
jgi:hypothetical protein